MLPEVIESEAALEELLSAPPPALVEMFRQGEGDVLILGVGGKMGPTLARMAKRAADAAKSRRRIIGVSRFSDERLRSTLETNGVETISCDLLKQQDLDALPDAPNIIYMAGMKFGASGNEAMTWAMNTHLPAMVAQRYRSSRIVAFSTGNVYGLSPVSRGGSLETDQPAPVGEYAMSCLGRERIFEHFSRTLGTKVTLIRLNYACELRYGVLVDLAMRIREHQPIDLSMGHFNVIWQGDANAVALQSLGSCTSPPFILNLTGPETLSVRTVCQKLGQRLGEPVEFIGSEAPDALLSDASQCQRLFGPPTVDVDRMLVWIAHWLSRGGRTFNKPTHFETRDGKF
jgi:nucleoside-diphosphate-sugar epimerase